MAFRARGRRGDPRGNLEADAAPEAVHHEHLLGLGQVERDRIQLTARTREVESAQAATANAKMATNAATDQAARLQAELDQLKATLIARLTSEYWLPDPA